MPEVKQRTGLTGNQLKIIAMITMTLDHVGLMFFPGNEMFRILGRLAMPIYAYMIAEGCRYTHDRKKYFLRLFGLGALCQVVYFVAMGSLYQCILITFSLSVASVFAIDWGVKRGNWMALLTTWTVMLGILFVCDILPMLLPGTDYAVDYGRYGVALPVLIWFGRTKKERLLLMTVGLVLLAFHYGGTQWYALLALPLLALYNGQRGKIRMGKLFYIYYPLHLVILQGLALLLK